MKSTYLSERQIQELKAEFDQFDINNDGSITIAEIRALLENNGLCAQGQEANHFMEKYDTNKDHFITFQEYMNIFEQSYRQKDLRKQALNLFLEFDLNGNGTISGDEAISALKKWNSELKEQDISRILETFDISGDGIIDFDEFYRLLKRF